MKIYYKNYYLNVFLSAGPTGPTGPSNLLDSKIFATYNDSDMPGNLSIQSTLTVPSNSNIFVPYTDQININENGYYEFTISGYLTESTKPSTTSLVLKTSTQNDSATNNLIIVRLNNYQIENYFSYHLATRKTQTKYGFSQKVTLLFNKDASSDAHISDVSLAIKKIPWTYNH